MASTASSSFCLSCSSELVEPNPWLTPCCSTPICSSCLGVNPRLKDYIPCLRCGDVRTAAGSAAIQRGTQEAQRRRREEEEGMFTIGDGDDDDDDVGEGQGRLGDEPPSYDQVEAEAGVTEGAERLRGQEQGEARAVDDGEDEEEEEMETVEIKHPVSKSDTILSIARRYAADPHEILSLNALPPSVLSTQPHLLRTRRTLIISRRLVPRSKLADPTLFDSSSFDATLGQALDPDEEAKREKERAVKRFQLLTKTVDPGVGKAYIGLSELEEEEGLLGPPGEGEREGYEESHARGERSGKGMTDKERSGMGVGKARSSSGKKVLREPENREDRALEAFYRDESWQDEVGEPERGKGIGKWKTVGNGSNLGIKV